METRGSPLLADEQTAGQLEAHARAIIEDAVGALRGGSEVSQEEEDRISEKVGDSRAKERVHPGESLLAGLELSEAALSVVGKELSPDCPETMVQVASTIHRSTVERMMRASVSYVERLLGEVQESQARERHRMGRELHDRVASPLAVLYQNLGLYEALKGEDSQKAGEKLELMREMTQDALSSIRELSTELRRSVDREGLEAALSDLLSVMVPEGVHAAVSVKGDEKPIPEYVKEELFLTLREAIRNAVAHSGAGCVRVGLIVEPGMVSAEVLDDGRGFEPEGKEISPGTGVEAMNERVHLLGGAFRIDSEPGAGTRVEVQVPLQRR